MRNEARFDRDAGNNVPGTLTSPNVSVPDQNGRPPAFSSSGSAVLRVVLGSSFLLPQRRNALGQNTVECRCLAFRLNCLQSRRMSLSFLLNELHHALTILIFVFLRVELALQHFH